jgi:hypothetical protein
MYAFRMLVLVGLAACGGSETARLTSTLYTGTCDWSGSEWLGVERVGVELEYVPTGIVPRDLPEVGGCSIETRLFASESSIGEGSDIPKLAGSPEWTSSGQDGILRASGTGLWTDDVSPPGGCLRVDEVAAQGVELVGAGVLDGVTTPAPGTPGLVYLDGVREDDWTSELAIGQDVMVSWTAEGWSAGFVQVRQLNGGQVRQVLTCNTTGLQGFQLGASVWDQLDDIGADALQVYVGFQTRESTSRGGEDIEVITRMVHVIDQD